MTRYHFGGTGDAVVIKATGAPYAGAACTVWTAQSGGTQITDLLDADGDPVTSLVADAYGMLEFQGPDDATAVVYIDGPGTSTRTRLVAWDYGGGGGGGAVDSVNGDTGTVVLDAADVGAVPAATATTKGDLLVRDTTGVTRLGVGTNDYVLTADSSQSTGVKWAAASGGVTSVNGETGAVTLTTDDVSDSGQTARYTSASDISKLAGIEAGADVTDATNVAAAGAVMASLVTAKGDVLAATGSGALDNLAVGSDGYILTADATATTGVKWAANTGTGRLRVSDYGVKADARFTSDAAIDASSAVLTSATAAFTAADVGKVVVVNNAKGARSHLYSTVASYQSATQVTLSHTATATVTSAMLTIGTDDTAAMQACLDATATTGVLQVQLANTPTLITSALTISTPMALFGHSVARLRGSQSGSGADRSIDVPTVPPYLSGSVLVVAAPSVNAVTMTLTGSTVDLRDFGVLFAGLFGPSGHGIEVTAPASSTRLDNGLMDARWDNVVVMGHDGDHYAYVLTNFICSHFSHLHSFGGGGLHMVENGWGNYGNSQFDSFYCQILVPATSGTVHGMQVTSTHGGGINLCQFNRTQVLSSSSELSATFPGYGSSWGKHASSKGMQGNNETNMVWIASDFEGCTFEPNDQNGIFFGTPSYGIGTSGWSRPLMFKETYRGWGYRLDNYLHTVEGAGSKWSLLYDEPASADWAISTDGTKQMRLPGSLKATGALPSLALGAGAGSTPPSPISKGSDLAGRVSFGTGTSASPGALATLTFASSTTYDLTPIVVVTANNSATAGLGLYVSAVSTTAFTVSCTADPTDSQGTGTYDFSYIVMGGVGTPTITALDTFTRADSTSTLGSAETGGAWTAGTGITWGISSNAAYRVSGSGIAYLTTTLADCTIDVAIPTVSGGYGVACRIVDSSNYLMVALSDRKLYKVVSGSWTSLGNFTDTSTWSNGDIATVVLNGSSIKVRKNGTQVASYTDSTHVTAVKHGLYADNSTVRFDNLQIV